MKWLNKIISPDTTFFNNYYDKAMYLLAWRISLIFIITFIIISIFYSFSGFSAVFPSLLVIVVGIFCLSYLYLTKQIKTIFWTYTISGTVLAHYAMNTVMNLTHYVDFLWIMVCIFIAFIGLGRKVGITLILINIVLLAFFFVFTLNKHIEILDARSIFEIIGEFIELLAVFFIISYLTYQYLIFQSKSKQELQLAYIELEKQNKLISSRNNENILLMKEVHHRVKNNLQIITSLLRLQKNNLPEDIGQKFDESINRIMTMAIIHRKLYQSDNLSHVNMDAYIKELIDEILSSHSSENTITTNINTNNIFIGLKTVVPLGLLLNELLSNSFKHAFNNEQSDRRISIELSAVSNTEFVMLYSDNGIWKTPFENQHQFGLELVETLTEQMDGSYQRENSEYRFKLKNLDIEA
ncbi:MAG: sensor histidine kinase [Vicingaceae bacterium]|nr:sensor histidine kinase [Vicingaceae bacterium]